MDPEPTRPGGEDAAPLRRYFLWSVLVATLVAIALAALLTRDFAGRGGGGEAPPVLGVVPDFELINRDGRTVHRHDLLGKPWVADFIFTRCQVSCPVLTARMAQLQERLPGDDLRFVSFSVDPVHDRPEVLQAFAEQWGAEDRWWFLTGELAEMYSLIRDGFKVGVAAPANGVVADELEPITHSSRLVLVDAESRVRGYYDGMGPEGQESLLADLSALRAGR